MSDRNVHVDTHPSGHPNKTAVNTENPIFGRPADPIPEVSVEQAAVVQSDKNARETVVSPLINEAQVEAPVVETKTYTDGTTATGVAPLPEQSPAQQDAEAAQDSEPVAEASTEPEESAEPEPASAEA